MKKAMVLTRALPRHNSVATAVAYYDENDQTAEYDPESHAREVLSEIRDKFVTQFPEFAGAWNISYVNEVIEIKP